MNLPMIPRIEDIAGQAGQMLTGGMNALGDAAGSAIQSIGQVGRGVGDALAKPENQEGLGRLAIALTKMGNTGRDTRWLEEDVKRLEQGRTMQITAEALTNAQRKWESGDQQGALADLDKILAKPTGLTPEAVMNIAQFRVARGQEYGQGRIDREWIESLTGNESPLDLIKSGIGKRVRPETLKLIHENKSKGLQFIHDAKLGLVGHFNPVSGAFTPLEGFTAPEGDDAIKPTPEQDAHAINLYGQGMVQLKKDAQAGIPRAREALGQLLAITKTQDPVFTRKDIEKYLADRGWTKEHPDYSKHYLNLAKVYPMMPGAGLKGSGDLDIPFAPGYKGGTTPGPLAAGATTPPPTTGATTGGGLLAERKPSPEQTDQYVHKKTLEPAKAGMTLTQLEGGEYAKVPAQAVGKMGILRSARAAMESIEEIIAKRTDLFPVLTGDRNKDAKAVTAARLKLNLRSGDGFLFQFSPYKGTDPDVSRLLSNLSALPTFARGMGDVGNLAQKEQEIHALAVGLGSAEGRQAALSRIDNIRGIYNSGLEGLGLTGVFTRRDIKDTQVPEKKTRKGLKY